MAPDNVRFSMDEVIDLFVVLPIPTFVMVYVRDAELIFMAWPRSLVILP